MLQAIIFDFDGLVIDTEAPIMYAWMEVYREYGFELREAQWALLIGGTYSADTFDPHADLAAKLGRTLDYDELEARTLKRSHELIADQPILPGVRAWIAAAEGRGLKLAVASSSPRDWVEGHLARLGLRGHFAAVKTADDVAQVKPDPALYAEAVSALAVPPGAAAALEDSTHGIEAANRAGLTTVAVPTPLTQGMDFSTADYLVESLAAFTLDDLLADLNGAG